MPPPLLLLFFATKTTKFTDSVTKPDIVLAILT